GVKGESTNKRRSKWLNRDIAGKQCHDHRTSHGGRPAEGDLEQQREHEWNSGNYQPIDAAGRIANAKRWNTQHTEVKNSAWRSEEHTSELQSRFDLVCRLLLEKKKETRTQ